MNDNVMNRIRILPEKVSSQIAAGEMIDRPASVVRELMDNGIDASANRIQVQFERGGKNRIKVVDNGEGMSRDDLLLSVERHATSKIQTAEDLFSIHSLGFRGEALPSIASVSHLEITSRQAEQVAGHRLRMAGGKLKSIDESGSPNGTAVIVERLFFNVPARRKFMRAVRTETDRIVDVFSRIALPFNGITFRLEEAGKSLLHFPASRDHLPRLAALFGRDVAASLIEVRETYHDMALHAYLSPPELSRNRADRLYVYVNRRHIRDRLVTRAIAEGYGQRLMKGRYPQAVLFIGINASGVDVNIHPAKQEVRFHDGRDVMKGISSFIERALSGAHLACDVPGMERRSFPGAQETGRAELSEPTWSYRQAPSHSPGAVSFPAKAPEQATLAAGLRIIGQLGETYILCQTGEGLLMVDQHAAHERVVYETLKKGIQASHLEIQRLLVPLNIELSVKETRIALEKMEGFIRFGIELDHFGGNTFLLRAVPALLERVPWDRLIPEFIEQWQRTEPDREVLVDRALTVMACHGAIRAGKRMTREEMTLLIGQLEQMDLPTHCPHGRPITRCVTYRELEKMFKRVL